MHCACAMLSSVVCPALKYFSTSSENRMILCFDFYTTFVCSISHCNKNSKIWSYMYVGLHVNHPLFLSDFNETWTFSAHIFWKRSNIEFRNNPYSGNRDVQCRRTEGQTGRQTERLDEASVASRNSGNAPKNQWLNTSQGSSRCFMYDSCGANIRNLRKYGVYTGQNTLIG